jgi:hypothetical protein
VLAATLIVVAAKLSMDMYPAPAANGLIEATTLH